jgi:hypothetical protein
MSADGPRPQLEQKKSGAALMQGALRLLGALILVLFLGQASATLIADIWLAPHCEAYAAAHAIDYDGVRLRHLKKRKIAARLSPCLFSDRTGEKAQVPVRWRELSGVSFLTRLGVDPAINSLIIGAGAAAYWLTFSASGVAYRKRVSGG